MSSIKADAKKVWGLVGHYVSLSLRNLFWLLISILLLTSSSLAPANATEQVRAFTRNTEFDFVAWTLDALGIKLSQAALGAQDYLDTAGQHDLVLSYIDLVGQAEQLDYQISSIYADPNQKDPLTKSADQRKQLADLNVKINHLAPLVESIIQSQVTMIAAEQGLTVGGVPPPPVMYHVTDLPLALIVSPLNAIKEDQDISLQAGMTAAGEDSLEKQVEGKLNVSALVVEIGGIGIYPTMVERTSDLNWLTETIAHEWTHNFLTLRPLGLNYDTSNELRTMNETTAVLVGHELGSAVIQRFYPEKAPPPPPVVTKPATPAQPAQIQEFNFALEMHETRVTVDRLLAENKVKEAEDYMEERRQLFVAEGYLIRRLNQAYFAFYGAYNDVAPGGNATGQAGQDPVGPAVAALRQKSGSLAAFLNRISWMSSFDQLKKAVQP